MSATPGLANAEREWKRYRRSNASCVWVFRMRGRRGVVAQDAGNHSRISLRRPRATEGFLHAHVALGYRVLRKVRAQALIRNSTSPRCWHPDLPRVRRPRWHPECAKSRAVLADQLIAKFILVASRPVNTLVWALLFIGIFGPGALAGTMAIAFRSIGFVGKTCSVKR